MHPIDPPAGRGDLGVDEIDGAPEIVRGKARPAPERAEAEMETECDVVRQSPGKPSDRRDMGRDIALPRTIRWRIVDRTDFPRAVPLQREILVRNRLENGVKFGRDCRLVAGTDACEILGLRKRQ